MMATNCSPGHEGRHAPAVYRRDELM